MKVITVISKNNKFTVYKLISVLLVLFFMLLSLSIGKYTLNFFNTSIASSGPPQDMKSLLNDLFDNPSSVDLSGKTPRQLFEIIKAIAEDGKSNATAIEQIMSSANFDPNLEVEDIDGSSTTFAFFLIKHCSNFISPFLLELMVNNEKFNPNLKNKEGESIAIYAAKMNMKSLYEIIIKKDGYVDALTPDGHRADYYLNHHVDYDKSPFAAIPTSTLVPKTSSAVKDQKKFKIVIIQDISASCAKKAKEIEDAIIEFQKGLLQLEPFKTFFEQKIIEIKVVKSSQELKCAFPDCIQCDANVLLPIAVENEADLAPVFTCSIDKYDMGGGCSGGMFPIVATHHPDTYRNDAATMLHELLHCYGFGDEYVFPTFGNMADFYCGTNLDERVNAISFAPKLSHYSSRSEVKKELESKSVPWQSYIAETTSISSNGEDGGEMGTVEQYPADVIAFYPEGNCDEYVASRKFKPGTRTWKPSSGSIMKDARSFPKSLPLYYQHVITAAMGLSTSSPEFIPSIKMSLATKIGPALPDCPSESDTLQIYSFISRIEFILNSYKYYFCVNKTYTEAYKKCFNSSWDKDDLNNLFNIILFCTPYEASMIAYGKPSSAPFSLSIQEMAYEINSKIINKATDPAIIGDLQNKKERLCKLYQDTYKKALDGC